MDRLVKVCDGGPDIVIGISGFGSARVDPKRWERLGELTGRTALVLQYDAQDFEVPLDGYSAWSLVLDPTILTTFYSKWAEARSGGAIAADYLAPWLERWVDSGRRVMIVAFSLGAYVAWGAVRRLLASGDRDLGGIDLVLISGALGDQATQWSGIERLGSVVNVYSIQDYALRLLYPVGVGSDETPAAGLGPLSVRSTNIHDVDVTDMIGADHLWASRNLQRLIEVSMGCYWSVVERGVGGSVDDIFGGNATHLSPACRDRSYRWMVSDPTLWQMLGDALEGDADAIARCAALDQWALQGRLGSLMDAGAAARALMGMSSASAHRSRVQISGYVTEWIEVTLGSR